MPSKRMIAPSFWQSETVSQWTFRQRLLFIGLFSNADDQGRLRAHPSLIRSLVFPFDDIPLDEIKADIQAIADSEAVILYDAGGKSLIQIANWWTYQKPKWAWPSEYLPPPDWVDRCRYRVGNKPVKLNWDDSPDDNTSLSEPEPDGSETTVEPLRNQSENPVNSAPRTRTRISDSNSDSGEEPGAVAPETSPRDFLDDVLTHAQKPKPEGRPKGWETVTESEFAICKRVADLWCSGKLPTGRWGSRIEKQCAGADELLEYHGGDLQACLLTIDKYHEFYSDDGADFSVAGPQSLVGVIPGFMADGKKPRASPGRKRGQRREYETCTEEQRQAMWDRHGEWMQNFMANKIQEIEWRVPATHFQTEVRQELDLVDSQAQALCEAYIVWENKTMEPLNVEAFLGDG
jgi:hypothetical protein